ncbi:MAG: MASE4 domain-containing protein [Paracoccaceae bacterium]
MVALLVAGLLAVAPFASAPVEASEAFIPAYATALLALDLVAATLLIAQFSALGAVALLPLAATYLFVGLTAATWALTFPGVFSAEGLLGGDRQTTAVIAAFRRLAFPLGVLAYVVARRWQAKGGPALRRPRFLVAGTVMIALFAAAAVTWMAVEMAAAAPGFMVDERVSTATWTLVLWASIVLTVAATLALLRLELTVLDLWLLVTLAAFFIEILLLGFLASGVRLTVGWWAGRAFGLASTAVVALALLAETAALTVRAVRSLMVENQARQARTATLEALAASIAHETNQPLSAIVTSADAAVRWLDRPQPDVAAARARLAAISADGARAAQVVTNLRSAFGARPIARVAVDIPDLLRSAIMLAGSDAKEAGATISVELASSLPLVAGNPAQLRQVLLNLLGNAFEAVSSARGASRAVKVRAWAGGDHVHIAVSDSGPGMSCDMLAGAFEPFRSTKPEGMGLGLMICRTIVEAHGGRIAARPGQGGGAVIEFSLPSEAPRD